MVVEHNFEQVHTEHAVLDIGQDIGALVIYTGAVQRREEIEVSLKGLDGKRVHTAVLERRFNGNTFFAALFMSLSAGDYTIWKDDTHPGGAVTIVGGRVAEVDWR